LFQHGHDTIQRIWTQHRLKQMQNIGKFISGRQIGT
jgi:hypothetical protein